MAQPDDLHILTRWRLILGKVPNDGLCRSIKNANAITSANSTVNIGLRKRKKRNEHRLSPAPGANAHTQRLGRVAGNNEAVRQ